MVFLSGLKRSRPSALRGSSAALIRCANRTETWLTADDNGADQNTDGHASNGGKRNRD